MHVGNNVGADDDCGGEAVGDAAGICEDHAGPRSLHRHPPQIQYAGICALVLPWVSLAIACVVSFGGVHNFLPTTRLARDDAH